MTFVRRTGALLGALLILGACSGAPDQAEDLVQETFLRAFRSWDQYTRGTAAKSWLFTICRNVFLRRRFASSCYAGRSLVDRPY